MSLTTQTIDLIQSVISKDTLQMFHQTSVTKKPVGYTTGGYIYITVMQVVTSRLSKKPFSNFVVFHSVRKAYTNFDALKSHSPSYRVLNTNRFQVNT